MSFNEKYIVSGAAGSGDSGYAYLFDRESGQLLWKREVDSPLLDASISADGSKLVASTDWSLLFFDGKSGANLWNHTGTASLPTAGRVRMTPDGQYIVGGVWGGGSGKDIQLFNSKGDLVWFYPSGTVYSVDISRDASGIVAATSSKLGNWQNSPSTVYFFEKQDNSIDDGNVLRGLSASPILIVGGIALVGTVVGIIALIKFRR